MIIANSAGRMRRTPRPELDETETPGLTLVPDDRGDEVAGNHEEHVHADKTAGKPRNAKVEQHHGDHRDCAQAVDIPSISECAHKIFNANQVVVLYSASPSREARERCCAR
jgi:hypothetical protein